LYPQILANVEKLGIPEEYKDFERALLAHRRLDKLVSMPVLPADYADIIQSWRKAVLELFLARNITFPNKMHIVYHHLEDYYDESGESLTKTTDQTVESAHQWFDKLLHRSNYWVKDALSDRAGKQLLKGD
jgi:hypothetical protein